MRVEAEDIMTVASWPTQPCVAVTPDSRCAKDTYGKQLSMLQMPGKEHEARPLVNMSFMVFRLSGNPLKCGEFLRGLGTSSYNVELSISTHKH